MIYTNINYKSKSNEYRLGRGTCNIVEKKGSATTSILNDDLGAEFLYEQRFCYRKSCEITFSMNIFCIINKHFCL